MSCVLRVGDRRRRGRPWSGLVLALVLALAVGALLGPAAGSAAADPVISTGAPDPTVNPAHNIAADPAPSAHCYNAHTRVDSPTTAQCTADGVAALNNARHALGQPSYTLPAGFAALTPTEQLVVLADSDRGYYQVGTIAGMSAALNADARAAVAADRDPSCADCASGSAADWSVDYSAIYAYYGWLYDDGPGSGRPGCTTQDQGGCWSLRQNILMWSGDIAMGVGVGPSPHHPGLDGYAALFDAGSRSDFVPIVSRITPTTGTTGGGTNVVVIGYGLQNVSSVRFGTTAAASLAPVSDRELTAVSPPGAFGPVSITATGPGGASHDSVDDVFRYLHPSTVTLAVTPATGSTLDWRQFTATVSPSSATGSVSLTKQGKVLATATLAGGVARFTTEAGELAVGTNLVGASYAGDTADAPSTSDLTTVHLNAPASGALGSLNPARVLDTRYGIGATRAAVGPGATITLVVAGQGGVPAAGAAAVALNVTATGPTAPGAITVYPTGQSRPTTSNLNFVRGQTIPNLVIATLGTGGAIDLHNSSTGSVELIADVAGYFVSGPASDPGTYVGLATPARVLDTRYGIGAGAGVVPPDGSITLAVAGHGGVPAGGVGSVVLNVTATAPTAAGEITVFPAGTTRPVASNVNYAKGQTIPNLVIATVGSGGAVTLYNGSTGSVQVIADVAGYFLTGTPTDPGAYVGLSPVRVLDTRSGNGAARAAVPAHGSIRLTVAGRGGVPSYGAGAVALNVTVTGPGAPGVITVYPTGQALPGASNLNFVRGETVPNLVLAPIGAGGTITLYNSSVAPVQLIADVSGYTLSG